MGGTRVPCGVPVTTSTGVGVAVEVRVAVADSVDGAISSSSWIRCWLQRTSRSEEEILRHYRLTSLEELPALTATRILERLIRLDHDTRQVRRRDGGEAR